MDVQHVQPCDGTLIFEVFLRKIKFTHSSGVKQYGDPFALSCKYLSVGVCLLFAVAKGPMCTPIPLAHSSWSNVCPGHFALIARESRRNDCRMKPVETGMQFSRYPLVASVPNHYNYYYYYYNPSLYFARNEKHTTRLETMDIMMERGDFMKRWRKSKDFSRSPI